MKNGPRAVRFASVILCAVLLFVSLASSVFAFSGSDYTDDEQLASRLDEVFAGDALIFQNEDQGYPIGSSIGTYPAFPHRVAGLLGYECYIYANAVYYYLFEDVPYHGNIGYKHSTVPLRGGDAITYELLRDNGINCGAYVRTTSSSDGTYNGASGHSFIILEYDRDGIDVLQANNEGPGIVSLDRYDWDTFDLLLGRYWGGYISHVINPIDDVSTTGDGETVHPWTDWIVAVEPGCYTDGYAVRVCADCGRIEKKVLPACHKFGGGVETVPATWEQEGQTVYTCQVCGYSETRTVPKITLADYFTDVPDGEWYYTYVEYAFRNGLMNGMTGGKFAPEEEMSRAMIVTVLWRIEGSPESEGESPFGDLTEEWYKKAVAWAAESGVVKGVEEGAFAPDDPLTREQIAAIVYRYSEYKGLDVTPEGDLLGFPDESYVSEYAREPLAWAVGRGLLKGTTNGKGQVVLDPRGGATRAQVATILTRYLTE